MDVVVCRRDTLSCKSVAVVKLAHRSRPRLCHSLFQKKTFNANKFKRLAGGGHKASIYALCLRIINKADNCIVLDGQEHKEGGLLCAEMNPNQTKSLKEDLQRNIQRFKPSSRYVPRPSVLLKILEQEQHL